MIRNDKTAKSNKIKRIEIRCTENEYTLLQTKVKEANYKQVSDFIRDRCLHDTQIVLDASEFAKMLVKLNVDMSGVSNNINQVTKAINVDRKTNGNVKECDFQEFISHIVKYNNLLEVLDKELKKLLRHTSKRKTI